MYSIKQLKSDGASVSCVLPVVIGGKYVFGDLSGRLKLTINNDSFMNSIFFDANVSIITDTNVA